MQPNQQLTKNGMQVCLFPLPRLHVTQGINTTFTHFNSLAMDFIGWTTQARLYAPCDMICTSSSTGIIRYTSLAPVFFADGTSDYFTIMVIHDNNTYPVGRIVLQGEWFANTGTEGNITGDHTHIETKRGFWEGWEERVPGSNKMKNQVEPFLLFAINDTIITQSGGYDWREVQPGLPIWLM
jgi:hypothetical protein